MNIQFNKLFSNWFHQQSAFQKFLRMLFCATFLFSLSANAAECLSCHAQQHHQWLQSDHAKAMAKASDTSVLGDFNKVRANHFSQSALFFKDKALFKVTLTEAGRTTDYTIDYTFGHYPLQQYLIKTDKGRYQVLPFSWDSRSASEGGQRWYGNYESEDILPNDRLHWQQPLQNWNGMCADCHSDNLKRNYSVDTDRFNTQFSGINISCVSCHGTMKKDHGKLTLLDQESPQPTTHNQKTTSYNSHIEHKALLSWFRKPDEKIAQLLTSAGKFPNAEEKAKHGAFMEGCFSCHSLRSPLTDGFNNTTAYLDQFSPSMLEPHLYHADGQIKEEVYVYGSFKQSKMHAAGVTCLDCHQSHTMKVKIEGNGLCLQCHNPENYQTKNHTGHALTSTGSQCVNCHMPATTYMGVDARRDHSFKIPRPDLSVNFQTPNACTNCHSDKDANWAAQALTKLHGKPQPLANAEQLYLRLMHDRGLPLEQHLALINDGSMSEIKRASAIAQLVNSTQTLNDATINPWVSSPLPLIRLATAHIGQLLPITERVKSYSQLVNDRYKAVRVAAANHLVEIPVEQLHGLNLKLIDKAFSELTESNRVNSWRGEGNINRSLIAARQGDLNNAINALKHSIKIDPYFEQAYVNLSDLYRQLGERQQEIDIFKLGITTNPKSAVLHYAYGMHMIRQGDKSASVSAFAKSMEIDQSNIQYAYLYFLAQDATGKTVKALAELKLLISRYNYHPQLVQLGLNFAQKIGDRESYEFFIKRYNP